MLTWFRNVKRRMESKHGNVSIKNKNVEMAAATGKSGQQKMVGTMADLGGWKGRHLVQQFPEGPIRNDPVDCIQPRTPGSLYACLPGHLGNCLRRSGTKNKERLKKKDAL